MDKIYKLDKITDVVNTYLELKATYSFASTMDVEISGYMIIVRNFIMEKENLTKLITVI